MVRSTLRHSSQTAGPKGKLKLSATLWGKFFSPWNFTEYTSNGSQKWLPRIIWIVIDASAVTKSFRMVVEMLHFLKIAFLLLPTKCKIKKIERPCRYEFPNVSAVLFQATWCEALSSILLRRPARRANSNFQRRCGVSFSAPQVSPSIG